MKYEKPTIKGRLALEGSMQQHNGNGRGSHRYEMKPILID